MTPQTPERRPSGDDRAPVGGLTTAPSVAQPDHDDADDAPRCRICRRPLTAPASAARELGPHCAARLAASIARATGYRAAVAVVGGALVARLDREGAGA